MAAAPSDRQRRCSTEMMLTALTTGLAAVREPRLVRERFEDAARASRRGVRHVSKTAKRPNGRIRLVRPAGAAHGTSVPRSGVRFEAPVDDRARQMLASARRSRACCWRSNARTAGGRCRPRAAGRRCGAAHRLEPGDSGRPRSNRARRGHRFHDPDRRANRAPARSSSRGRSTS